VTGLCSMMLRRMCKVERAAYGYAGIGRASRPDSLPIGLSFGSTSARTGYSARLGKVRLGVTYLPTCQRSEGEIIRNAALSASIITISGVQRLIWLLVALS
jgi:hypothetical protein